jgi:hypothetical protein
MTKVDKKDLKRMTEAEKIIGGIIYQFSVGYKCMGFYTFLLFLNDKDRGQEPCALFWGFLLLTFVIWFSWLYMSNKRAKGELHICGDRFIVTG